MCYSIDNLIPLLHKLCSASKSDHNLCFSLEQTLFMIVNNCKEFKRAKMASKYSSYKLCIVVVGLALISVVLQPKQVECQDSAAAAAAAASDSDSGSGSGSGSAAAAAAASGGSSRSGDVPNFESIFRIKAKDIMDCALELLYLVPIRHAMHKAPDACCKIKIFQGIPACPSKEGKKKPKSKHTKLPENDSDEWSPGDNKEFHKLALTRAMQQSYISFVVVFQELFGWVYFSLSRRVIWGNDVLILERHVPCFENNLQSEQTSSQHQEPLSVH